MVHHALEICKRRIGIKVLFTNKIDLFVKLMYSITHKIK